MASLFVWVSCAVYDSSLLGPLVAADASDDQGADAGPGADADTCPHRLPPARPSADDPGGSDIDLVTAVDTLSFGFADGGVPSYDLDRTCTCPAAESCIPLKGAPKHCDRVDGEDNSGGALLSTFSKLLPGFDDSTINQRLGTGQSGMLIRLQRYNGKPNDTSVSLSMYVSRGTGPIDDAGVDPIPNHDGTDQWIVDTTSLVGGTAPPYVPKYLDDNAYVAGSVLVGTLDFPLALGGSYSATFVELRSAVITADVVPMNGSFGLKNAIIAGRWDTRNLLTGMQVLGDPLNQGQYLCGNDATYQTFKAEICKAADVAADPQNDGTNAPCSAISLSLGFDSEPAQFGGAMPSSAGSTPCGPTYTDQCGQ